MHADQGCPPFIQPIKLVKFRIRANIEQQRNHEQENAPGQVSDSMPKDDQSEFKIARTRRDATVVIRGYVYQVNMTLLRWIGLNPGEALQLEAGEDIDTIQKAVVDASQMTRLLEDIKHRERHLTLRSPEALSALAAFHEHRESNPSLRLRFRYVTNTAIGLESPPIGDSKIPGLYLWERVRNGQAKRKQKLSLLSNLRSFLQESARPSKVGTRTWASFLRYLKEAPHAELNRFIDAFEWSVEQGASEEVEGKVRYALRTSGKLSSKDDGRAAYTHLFHFVFSQLTRRISKFLTVELLEQELKSLTQADAGRTVINRLAEIESQIEARLESLEEKLDTLTPVVPLIHEMSETLSRVDQTVSNFSKTHAEGPSSGSAWSPPFSVSDTGSEPSTGKDVTGQSSEASANVLVSALLAQNEGLLSAVSLHAKDQLTALRDAARKGRRAEALTGIRSLKDNRSAWHALPAARKAEFLRLEASILLGNDDLTQARVLMEEARREAPDEDDSRLRACFAWTEHDAAGAIRILEGKQDPESKNLLALFLLGSGRVQDCLNSLPSIDAESSVRAETFRIQTLALLQNRDLPEARRTIAKALGAEPEWPHLRCLSAEISYYEALSPSALPPPIDGAPDPASLLFVVNSPESRGKLREAAETFFALSQLPQMSAEDRRLVEAWHLSTLVADRSRLKEARHYAQELLIRDPGQYRIVPWALSLQFTDIDLGPTEKALEQNLDNNLLQVAALAMLKINASKCGEAIETLDKSRELFFNEGNQRGWYHLRALAFLRSGQPGEAEAELGNFDSERHDPLWSELLRRKSAESGDWEPYAELLKSRYESMRAPDALLQYAEFHARRGHWVPVADVSRDLIERIGTADALYLAALAVLKTGRPDDCITMLESRKDLFGDILRSEELLQLSIAAKSTVGDLIIARKEAETLSAQVPSTENILLLARLQLNTGDLKGFAVNARRLNERNDLTSSQALQLAFLVRLEDPILSETLWRRAVRDGLRDEDVGAAVNLGYQLGLDKEMPVLFIRMYELAETGQGGIQRKEFADLVEHMRQHRENLDWSMSLYRKGEIAIHLIPQNLRSPLAVLYHEAFHSREREDGRPSGGLLIRHGGRLTVPGFPDALPNLRLNLDITSVLLAEHLGILRTLRHAFSSVRLPPSTFAALATMQSTISSAQISQIEAAKIVLAAVEAGEIQVLKLPDEGRPEFAAQAGDDWARVCELTRKMNGYLIDFLPKRGFSPLEHVLDLPSDIQSCLVNCRALAESLLTNGGLSNDEYSEVIELLGSEGHQVPIGGLISPNSQLLTQQTIAKLLAQAKLLKPIARCFRWYLPEGDFTALKELVQQRERAQKTASWLDGLIAYLRDAVNRGDFELIVTSITPSEDGVAPERTADAECLFELLTCPTKNQDVVCADDRYFNGFARTEGAPVITIIEILKLLVAAGHLTTIDYYRKLTALRAAGAFFIPLEPNEIIHHLFQSPLDANGDVLETRELAVLRRYWAQSLLLGKVLQRPDGSFPANPQGEVLFLQSSVNAIRDALLAIWMKDSITAAEKSARSEWIIGALHIDNAGIRCLTDLPPKGDALDLIAATIGPLILAAVRAYLADQSRLPKLKAYLDWLDRCVVERFFAADALCEERTAEFMRASLLAIFGSFKGAAERQAATLLVVRVLDFLPSALREAIQKGQEFMRTLGIETLAVAEAEELKFRREEYFRAATMALNAGRGEAQTWPKGEQIVFLRGKSGAFPSIVLKRPNGKDVIVADPLLGLLSDQIEDREKSLKDHPEWFDCKAGELNSAVESISRTADPAERVDQAQHWRDHSAAVYYNSLPQILKAQGFVSAHNLRPPDATAVLRHYRISLESQDSLFRNLESAFLDVCGENGLADAFIRYSGFPIPFPKTAYARLDVLSEKEVIDLVRLLMRAAGSPVSRLHFSRILVHLGETRGPRYRRLAQRVILHLLSDDGKNELTAFGRLLQWVEDGFAEWNLFSASAETRLAMIWTHAHMIFAALRSLGIPSGWVKARFTGADFGRSNSRLQYDSKLFDDVARPSRVKYGSLVVDGLSYVLGNEVPEWWTDSQTEQMKNLVNSVVKEETSNGLLRDTSLGCNVLNSFLQCDRSLLLGPLLGDDAAKAFSSENSRLLLSEYLKDPGSTTTGAEFWKVLFLIVGDLPIYADLRGSLESAITTLEVTQFGEDVESCASALYAASMQSTTLKSQRATEHLRRQIIELIGLLQRRSKDAKITKDNEAILQSMIDVCAHLSWSEDSVEAQQSRFAGLLTEIVNAYPGAISLYRSVLENLWPDRASELRLLWPLLVRSRAFS